MLVTSIFFFSHHVFYLFQNKFSILFHICLLQILSIWTGLKMLSFCKELKRSREFKQILLFPTSRESTMIPGSLSYKRRFQKNKTNLINTFPHKPWFLRICSTNLLKTLWKKEKLLAMINFSFSHNVFNTYGELPAIFIEFRIVVCKLFDFQFGSVKNLSFGKGLTVKIRQLSCLFHGE